MIGYYVTAGQGNGGPMVPCRDLEQAASSLVGPEARSGGLQAFRST